jgi:hypothetical protein
VDIRILILSRRINADLARTAANRLCRTKIPNVILSERELKEAK